MELLGGVDLLVYVFLGLEVDGLEGGLQQRVSFGLDPKRSREIQRGRQLRTHHDRKRCAGTGRCSIRSVVRCRRADGEASSGPQQ